MTEPPVDIVDLFTELDPLLGQGEEGDTLAQTLLALLDRHQVSTAVMLSARALHHAADGNREALEVCATPPRLLPAFVVDPRVPPPHPSIEGARLLCLLPATQNWPSSFAPVRRLLRALMAAPGPLVPLLFEARRAGDATAFGALVRETGYKGSIVLSGVGGAATLGEALAVADESESVYLATNGLCGVGEIAFAAQALGARRVVFASGAPVWSMGAALALVRHADLSPENQALILGGNARRLLNLPATTGTTGSVG